MRKFNANPESYKTQRRCPVCANFVSVFPRTDDVFCRKCNSEAARIKPRLLIHRYAHTRPQLKKALERLLIRGFRSPEWVAHRLGISTDEAQDLMFKD